MALNDKEERFCQVLAETGDQSKAYRAMLPNTKATSKSINEEASKFAKKPKILSRVAELQDVIKTKANQQFEITAERVALEIARLAFNDPRKAFDENGVMLPVQQWPDEVAAAISSIEMTELRTEDETQAVLKKVRFWDKGKQIELAAKHLGMLTDKLKLDATLASVDISDEQAQRIAQEFLLSSAKK